MRKGQNYEFKIETTQFPATGIANADGLKCYIKNAAQGQTVRARVTKKRREYLEAKILEKVEKAPYEIEAPCPHFDFCGGCTHQFMPYELQLKNKEREVLQLFKENDFESYEYEGISASPETFEYRNKMEFTFGDMEKDGEITLGMHMPNRGFSVVTVDHCMLIDEDVRKILSLTLEYFKALDAPRYKVMSHEGYLRNLVVRKSKKLQQLLINLVTTSQLELDLTEYTEKLKALDLKGKISGILHTTNDALADAVIPEKVEVLYGRDYIEEELLGLKFKISAFSFFQTNSNGAEKLYSIVREYMGDADNKTVFDLYCGTGTIGQIAAAKAEKVLGIELIEEAVESAKENAKLNNLSNCEFIAGDVAKVIQQVNLKPDIIILDPPRTGVHPTAMDYVVKFQAEEIIYVSCNPKTLMNDLKLLEGNGYKIEKVRAMDMFPMTGHCESVVKLVRKNS